MANPDSGAPGVTQAIRDLKLSMTVAGRVEAVLVREGQKVQKGEVLLQLDHTLETLEVKRRKLMLDDRARLNDLESKERVLQSQSAEVESLLKSGAVSRKQVEDEQMAYQSTRSERLMMEQAKAREAVELQLAEEALERRLLRSPIDGVITKIAFREGESIAAHEPVMAIADVSRVRFLGTLNPEQVKRVRAGAGVRLELGPVSERIKRSARLVYISPVTDAASGLVEVIAEFENAQGAVRPGVSGRLFVQ
jgi:RND family efflux transporter MFP subunit